MFMIYVKYINMFDHLKRHGYDWSKNLCLYFVESQKPFISYNLFSVCFNFDHQ